MSRLTRGYVIALVGITFWSTTGVFISYLTTNYQMAPLLLALWRNVLVCVALAPALLLFRPSLLHLRKTNLSFFIVYGLILSLFNSIWTLSVKLNGAAAATVLGYGSTAFTVLIAWWLFKEQLSLAKMIAVLLSLGGCVLVSNAFIPGMWQVNALGITVGLLSGLMFALYSLMGKEAARREINPWNSMLWSFACGSIFLVFFNLLPFLPGSAGSADALLPVLPWKGWLILVVLSFIPTILGFGLYNTSMIYLPASIANLLATLEPAMTAVEAYIFLGERMSILQVFGSALIISAVVIVRLFEDNRGRTRKR